MEEQQVPVAAWSWLALAPALVPAREVRGA